MPEMRRIAFHLLDNLGDLPILALFLLDPTAGSGYGLGRVDKLRMYFRFRRTKRSIETLSNVREHLEMALALLRIPPTVSGCVVECGCYRGGSTANLSVACAAAGRTLIVYDSFAGLPEPGDSDRVQDNPFYGDVDEYVAGRFAAGLEEVRANVERYGRPDVCRFVKGYFSTTLPEHDEPVVMAFLDVDLIGSLRDCLLGLWPHLCATGRVYMHEARSLTLATVMYETNWWGEQLGTSAPGLVGAGTGLPLVPLYGSQLGYSEKPRPESASS